MTLHRNTDDATPEGDCQCPIQDGAVVVATATRYSPALRRRGRLSAVAFDLLRQCRRADAANRVWRNWAACSWGQNITIVMRLQVPR